MKRRTLFVSLFLALAFSGSVFAQTFGAVLTLSQETPPCGTTGFGNATVTFTDSTHTNINVTITVSNLGSPITAFHIHKAPVGVPGGVVINLIGLGGQFVNGTMTGTFPIDAATAQGLLQDPGQFYVNVHTMQCGAGQIRGQLAFVSGGPVMYAAELRGANETPPNSSTAFGSALVTIDPVNSTIAFEENQSGVANPTVSHIHRGAAGVAGPVIINFVNGTAPLVFQGTRATGSGAISAFQSSSFTAADLTGLSSASTANGFYVNYHSMAFPGGEIRGQLVPAQEVDIPACGHVTNGAGQTFISDVRIFNPSFSAATTALIEFFPAGTSPNTTAAASMAVNLPARGTAVLNDIGGSLNVNTVGAMRITSVASLLATSRVFVNTPNGSFGQFVDAFARSQALRRGAMPQVSNTAAASGFRSNVGFFNPNQGPVTVRLEARDAAGNVFGSNVITLQALTQQQNGIGIYFPGVDVSNASNLTLSFDASAPIFAYVSEVDNTSADSFLIPAQPDPGVAASQ
jgi:CHRD domain-containing protein